MTFAAEPAGYLVRPDRVEGWLVVGGAATGWFATVEEAVQCAQQAADATRPARVVVVDREGAPVMAMTMEPDGLTRIDRIAPQRSAAADATDRRGSAEGGERGLAQ